MEIKKQIMRSGQEIIVKDMPNFRMSVSIDDDPIKDIVHQSDMKISELSVAANKLNTKSLTDTIRDEMTTPQKDKKQAS